MNVQLEITAQTLYNALAEPHSRYWASYMELNNKTLKGYVIEIDNDKEIKHTINPRKIKGGLLRVAKSNPSLFGRIIGNETDGPDRDIFLQLCIGLIYEDGPKYG